MCLSELMPEKIKELPEEFIAWKVMSTDNETFFWEIPKTKFHPGENQDRQDGRVVMFSLFPSACLGDYRKGFHAYRHKEGADRLADVQNGRQNGVQVKTVPVRVRREDVVAYGIAGIPGLLRDEALVTRRFWMDKESD